MKAKFLLASLFVTVLACQSDDDGKSPDTKVCKHIDMSIDDPDDPVDLMFDFDDNGRVTSIRGQGGDGEQVNLALQYDLEGMIENDLGDDYEIQMDAATKQVTMFKYGDMELGPGLLLTFDDNRIVSTLVANEDGAGVEAADYTYDSDGNATTVEAKLVDENGDDFGTYHVELTYDKAHKALFANTPFLQAYTTFSSYLLPFGLTSTNLVKQMTITFSFNDDVQVETRIINYEFNDQGQATSVEWSSSSGSFETKFSYDCY